MVRKALCFKNYNSFSSFFQREIFEVLWPIAAKFCRMVESVFNLQMPVQTFGACPQKNFGAKNPLNLAHFRTPSYFEREYLQNGQRYPKSENYLTHRISLPGWAKNVWWTSAH